MLTTRGWRRVLQQRVRERLRCCACRAAGASHDSPRTPKTPPKKHKKTPRETQKERNGDGKGKKKRDFFGPPPFGAPPFGAPPFGAPPFGCLFFYALFFRLVVLFFGQKTETPILAKAGLAKVGQLRLAKVGLAKVGIGQSRPIRMAKVGLAKVGISLLASVEVKFPHKHVRPHPSPCLAANPCGGCLQSEAPPAQHSYCGARCAMKGAGQSWLTAPRRENCELTAQLGMRSSQATDREPRRRPYASPTVLADAAVPLRIWQVEENHSEFWAYQPCSIRFPVADRVDTARRSRRLDVRACAGRWSDRVQINRVIRVGRVWSGLLWMAWQWVWPAPNAEPHGARRETRSPATRTSQLQRSGAAVGPPGQDAHRADPWRQKLTCPKTAQATFVLAPRRTFLAMFSNLARTITAHFPTRREHGRARFIATLTRRTPEVSNTSTRRTEALDSVNPKEARGNCRATVK